MSHRLYLNSFDWAAWQESIRPPATRLVEEVAFEIQCDRESDRIRYGHESYQDAWPESSEHLEQWLACRFKQDDWYAGTSPEDWGPIDLLFGRIFQTPRGGKPSGLADLLTVCARSGGILIETWDCGIPEPARGHRWESHCMGGRRFHGLGSVSEYAADDDNPEYSLHRPDEVARIFEKISRTASSG